MNGNSVPPNSGEDRPKPEKLRVTHLISGLPIGGAQTALKYLILGADRDQFDMNVVSLTTIGTVGKQLQQEGIDVRALGMPPGRIRPSAVLRLMQIIRSTNVDILQSWMYHADLLGGIAAIPFPRTKAIWNLRQTDLDPRHSKRLTRIVASLCAATSRVLPDKIVCGSIAARDVHARLGYDTRKMVLIENGVDVDRFVPSSDARSRVRSEINIDEATKLVGMVARFHPQKDHKAFVKVAQIIRSRRTDIEFVLCGEGIDETNSTLVDLIEQSNVSDCIHLLGRRSDIENVTAALDVSLSCSASAEGGPNTMFEALACGVPCVATDVGDSARIVGQAGVVVPPESPELLAGAVEHVLQHDVIDHLRRTARERAVDHFNVKKSVSRYEVLYSRALSPVG